METEVDMWMFSEFNNEVCGLGDGIPEYFPMNKFAHKFHIAKCLTFAVVINLWNLKLEGRSNHPTNFQMNINFKHGLQFSI
jgi:hypothetical protein